MYKFIISLIVLLAGMGTWAKNPWNVENDFVDHPQKNYLLAPMVNHTPIRIKIDGAPENVSLYKQMIVRAINTWFSFPTRLIYQTKRQEEFADILSVIERPAQIKFVENTHESQLEVLLVTSDEVEAECGEGNAACVEFINKRWKMLMPLMENTEEEKADWLNYFIHEFGHTLGLLDQHPSGLETELVIMSPHHHSTHVEPSIMGSGWYAEYAMGCDDVDGIINLIDILRGGARGVRAGKIWHSFCTTSDDSYLNGKRTVDDVYHIVPIDQSKGLWKITAREFGTKKISMDLQAEHTLQDILNYTGVVLQKDGYNRAVKTKGGRYSVVYQSFFQNLSHRMAFIGNKLAWVEMIRPPQGCTPHGIWFGGQGGITTLQWCRKPGGKGWMYYAEGTEHNTPVLEVRLDCEQDACQVTDSNGFIKRGHSLWNESVLTQTISPSIKTTTKLHSPAGKVNPHSKTLSKSKLSFGEQSLVQMLGSQFKKLP